MDTATLEQEVRRLAPWYYRCDWTLGPIFALILLTGGELRYQEKPRTGPVRVKAFDAGGSRWAGALVELCRKAVDCPVERVSGRTRSEGTVTLEVERVRGYGCWARSDVHEKSYRVSKVAEHVRAGMVVQFREAFTSKIVDVQLEGIEEWRDELPLRALVESDVGGGIVVEGDVDEHGVVRIAPVPRGIVGFQVVGRSGLRLLSETVFTAEEPRKNRMPSIVRSGMEIVAAVVKAMDEHEGFDRKRDRQRFIDLERHSFRLPSPVPLLVEVRNVENGALVPGVEVFGSHDGREWPLGRLGTCGRGFVRFPLFFDRSGKSALVGTIECYVRAPGYATSCYYRGTMTVADAWSRSRLAPAALAEAVRTHRVPLRSQRGLGCCCGQRTG